MLIAGYDIETTGLDTQKERIIEIGLAIYDTEYKAPIKIYSEFVFPGETFMPINLAAQEKNKIQNEWLTKYGEDITIAFGIIDSILYQYKPAAIVAHNGSGFDHPFTMAELARNGIVNHKLKEIPWLDSKTDIQFEIEPDSRRLKHLALDHGFINLFEHRAIFDVLTMLKIVGMYNIDEIIEQSKVPWTVIQCKVSYEDRQKAKDARFNWENIGDKKYSKCWVKKIRSNMLENEKINAEKNGYEVCEL